MPILAIYLLTESLQSTEKRVFCNWRRHTTHRHCNIETEWAQRDNFIEKKAYQQEQNIAKKVNLRWCKCKVRAILCTMCIFVFSKHRPSGPMLSVN